MAVTITNMPSRTMSRLLPIPLALAILGIALGRIHIRVQKTLIGYEIGRLKNEESKLLEERSFLKMQLAKLTTRKHLLFMSEAEGDSRHTPGSVAFQ